MSEDYRLEKISINDEWDNFVSASENGKRNIVTKV